MKILTWLADLIAPRVPLEIRTPHHPRFVAAGTDGILSAEDLDLMARQIVAPPPQRDPEAQAELDRIDSLLEAATRIQAALQTDGWIYRSGWYGGPIRMYFRRGDHRIRVIMERDDVPEKK